MIKITQVTSIALITGLTSLSMNLAQAAPNDQPDDKQEVVELNDQDPAMKAAFKKAKASLDTFLKVHATNDPDVDVESVRVRLTEGKVTEYVWIHPFEKHGKGFKGQVNSLPSQLKKLSVGGIVSFKREDIVDWTYFEIKARRMHGNYTTCVQLAKAPASEVESLKNAYGLDCSKNR
jgi:uncharacterized protein YegJ (DUF2314 family)